jgi:hypothetical protein
MSALGQKQTSIGLGLVDVRFTPKSGRQLSALECPLCRQKQTLGSVIRSSLLRLRAVNAQFSMRR